MLLGYEPRLGDRVHVEVKIKAISVDKTRFVFDGPEGRPSSAHTSAVAAVVSRELTRDEVLDKLAAGVQRIAGRDWEHPGQAKLAAKRLLEDCGLQLR